MQVTIVGQAEMVWSYHRKVWCIVRPEENVRVMYKDGPYLEKIATGKAIHTECDSTIILQPGDMPEPDYHRFSNLKDVIESGDKLCPVCFYPMVIK